MLTPNFRKDDFCIIKKNLNFLKSSLSYSFNGKISPFKYLVICIQFFKNIAVA